MRPIAWGPIRRAATLRWVDTAHRGSDARGSGSATSARVTNPASVHDRSSRPSCERLTLRDTVGTRWNSPRGRTLRTPLVSVLALLVVCQVASAQQAAQDLSVIAADGTKLGATWYSPGKPGPGMLLLHQCNMNRRAWTELGAALAQRGVHVLAIDYRGYGDSPRGNQLDSDIDSALAVLAARPGVNGARLAAGGASCGVRHAVLVARRSGRISALMLLSGPTPDEGIAWLRDHPETAIFGAATAEEDFAVRSLRTVTATSKHPATTMRVLTRAGHGVPMFAADSTLLPGVVDWVTRVLR